MPKTKDDLHGMAKVYYNLYKAGRWPIERMANPWKDQVVAVIEAEKEAEKAAKEAEEKQAPPTTVPGNPEQSEGPKEPVEGTEEP